MRRTHLLAALLGAVLAPGPLLAQAPMREPDATGALGPATRETTGVGQTKPPGAALGPDAGLTPDLQQRDREIQRKIDTGICDGCTE
ncbi:hypothetical protein [Methylobacterium frigidaeris]|uniref:Uncharacterized protein n=1 Tax=Methylobacterium frigidaeris TaxID=2038277 RepID=A0AA37HDN2_9HYPH|nr:hypothetical protein [Methylobacterium frigidaeris]PIK74649.1 hypothetical protein CS379_01370 [Methylobacterium frigidaeris]GJD64077.1 hypothetical protein MPEAHAMD_4251 [Methylobacterium frigidaeris]